MSYRPHPRVLFTIAMAAVLATGQVLAATPINETRPLDANGHLAIDNLKGSIEVVAWDRPEVRIDGSLGKGVEKLEIVGDRGRLAVRVKYPNRNGGRGFLSRNDQTEPTRLRLMVPLRADLEVASVSASIDVTGMASRELSIDSVSGDVTVAAAPAEIDIDTVSGDLFVTVNSGNVSLESVSGDIRLRGRLDGEVSVETVSGDIGVVSVESAIRRLSGATVSGDVAIDTALAANGRIQIESVSGDIEMALPKTLSANVSGESFSGDLTAPGATVNRPKRGPGSSFERRYGSGEGDVSIETFSGDARLRLK